MQKCMLTPMARSKRHMMPMTRAAASFAIVASASGNLVEWYDFYVYSFGALYFASQFFFPPKTRPASC